MGLLSLLSVAILSVYIIFPEKVRYFYFKRCRKLCQGFSFHFAKIIIFSENLSFFCCFFSFFRSHDCRIRSHDSVVIFLFRMFVSHTLPVGAEALKNSLEF